MVTCSVRPVISKDDGEYKLGLWVRDASAYRDVDLYDGETGWYGALGHGSPIRIPVYDAGWHR